jgi:CRISPR system Cascade subunit CasE
MYLTRLWLDSRSAQARRDLADPYDMHRTLVRAFVNDEAQEPPRFLWRIEPVGAWSEPVVLVQSLLEANWSVLTTLPGYLKRAAETKIVQPEQLLQPGARYRFRLFANPTVTRNGKRYGLVSEDTQLDWLARQGERLGFSVEAGLVTGSGVLNGRKGDVRISLQRTCFEGILKVLNVDSVMAAMQAGIGPGKAFGFGLLSIARC